LVGGRNHSFRWGKGGEGKEHCEDNVKGAGLLYQTILLEKGKEEKKTGIPVGRAKCRQARTTVHGGNGGVDRDSDKGKGKRG